MIDKKPNIAMNVNMTYPNNSEYDIEVMLKKINLDKERINDLRRNNGFIVTEPKSIKKDLKAADSIYSRKFGTTLQDVNAFENRYKCKCGNLQGRVYIGIKCPVCGEEVEFVDENYNYFGWLVLQDPYKIIHPGYYAQLRNFLGVNKQRENRMDNIIKPIDIKDEDGFSEEKGDPTPDEPFLGIGMIDFIERFDEIMEFYLKKYPQKKEMFDDIMAGRDDIFTQSIPVYTTQLRPFSLEDAQFGYEKVNEYYTMLSKLVHLVNNSELRMFRKAKPKNTLLNDIQVEFNKVYTEQINILATKKGELRQNFGGRFNFSARCVIAQEPSLEIDSVKLPYFALVELLKPTIINILKKSYNMTYSDAYKIWFKAQINKDMRVWNIIDQFIKDKGHIPILINRNPTINYGSIMFMRCIGINDNYTMSIPLQILKPLAGDFDGDVLNILYIINEAFAYRAEIVFSPKYAMMISHDDGKFDSSLNHSRDTLIMLNSFIELSRDSYTEEELNLIKQCQSME